MDLKSGKMMVRGSLRGSFRGSLKCKEKRKVIIRGSFRGSKNNVKILFKVWKRDKKIRKFGKK